MASGQFSQTQWTLVLTAAAEGSGADAALSQLCLTYWYPLYAFVRRQGQGHHEAEDLTQAFFLKLLEKQWLADADQERGRFRSFLLSAMKHFMANEWNRAQALKRGGGIRLIPIDGNTEDRFASESKTASPEELYEQRWAQALLAKTLDNLRARYIAAGQGAMFDALQPTLTDGKGAVRYHAVANSLGVQEGAVKVAAHRLRDRYRKQLREEIAQTVASEEEVEDEFCYLRSVLARG